MKNNPYFFSSPSHLVDVNAQAVGAELFLGFEVGPQVLLCHFVPAEAQFDAHAPRVPVYIISG